MTIGYLISSTVWISRLPVFLTKRDAFLFVFGVESFCLSHSVHQTELYHKEAEQLPLFVYLIMEHKFSN